MNDSKRRTHHEFSFRAAQQEKVTTFSEVPFSNGQKFFIELNQKVLLYLHVHPNRFFGIFVGRKTVIVFNCDFYDGEAR